MTRAWLTTTVFLGAIALASCGGAEKRADGSSMSRSPASVRGWVSDIQSTPTNYSVVKPMSDSALRSDLFSRTNVYVANAQFASGGIAENGSFILLDVPPGAVNIVFQIPGYRDASLQLSGVPENADVLIPGVIVTPNGARPADGASIQVRIPGETKRATGQFALVGGIRVPVTEAPLSEMVDRRDYPEPPKGPAAVKPLATVR